VIAARPATAVQLANACLAAGYSAVVPASWGDELVAAACLEALAARGDEATVVCSCPRVAERLRRVPSVRQSLLTFVAPPVAAARYLRARAGVTPLTITYVGDCPGAVDPAIDRYATPAALMRSLARRGIVPAQQATVMDSRVERDARRFYSLAGGVPAPNWVYAEGRGAGVVQPESSDYVAEIAHHVSERDRVVLDIAPRLGCACSGALAGEPWATARQIVTEMEPERAVHEVLDHDVIVDVSSSPDAWVGSTVGGVPTLPTTLPVLAAQYEPERKAPTIRRAPPSPVPFPSPTGPARRAGRTPAFPDAPLPKLPRAPEPLTAGVPLPPDPVKAELVKAEPASGPTRIAVEPITSATLNALRPNSPPRDWDGVDRRRWDGVERRRGWVSGQPPAPEPTTRPLRREPLTVPITLVDAPPRASTGWGDRRLMLGLAVACSAIVASATSILTVRLLTHERVAASVAGTAVTTPAPDSIAAPAPAPQAPDTIANVTAPADTAVPVAQPVVTGAPPAAPAPHRPRPRRKPPVAAAFSNAGAKPDTAAKQAPATVVAPGAAPVPTPTAPPPTESPELLQIRAEIAARKHRIDSLNQVMDSLRLLPARAPAPLPASPPGH
jgi:hypothetical protein